MIYSNIWFRQKQMQARGEVKPWRELAKSANGPKLNWTKIGGDETMTEKQAFEIPQQLRQLAEMNIEQARMAYGQFMDAMAQAMSAWSSASANAMTSGFQAVQERSIQFAKENAEAGFALASELAKAKNLQDVLKLQSSFAQKQMESYARQAQDLGRLMAEATRNTNPKGWAELSARF
jgi:phasin